MGHGKSRGMIAGFLLLVVMLSFVSSVYAITGSIGNARMILRVEQGDTIEKSILVKNVNDVSVDVLLEAIGDLADDIKIEDEENLTDELMKVFSDEKIEGETNSTFEGRMINAVLKVLKIEG